LVVHAFIISNYPDVYISVPSVEDSIGEIVVGEVEHAYFEGFLGFADVVNDLLDVFNFREEEGVHVSGFSLKQVFLYYSHKSSKRLDHLLVMIILHFGFSNGE